MSTDLADNATTEPMAARENRTLLVLENSFMMQVTGSLAERPKGRIFHPGEPLFGSAI